MLIARHIQIPVKGKPLALDGNCVSVFVIRFDLATPAGADDDAARMLLRDQAKQCDF